MTEKRTRTLPSTLVIVATLNEEQGIGSTLAEVTRFLDKPFCLVVDGRSEDGTVEIAESMGAWVVTQKGSGKGDAIATAIAHAQTVDTDYVAFIDGDYTYPAGNLPRMISILEQSPEAGMVCGNRFNGRFDLGQMHSLLSFGNRSLAFTHNFLNGVHLQDPLTGLRVARWQRLLRDWRPSAKGFDVEVELNHYVERKGYKIVEVPISYRRRLGEKKLKPRHGFTILARIMMESLRVEHQAHGV